MIVNNIKYLECDVHLTKDDQVVVAHDFDLTRTCMVTNDSCKFIGEYDYDELPPFR